jgi:hypothetical protein
MGIHETTISQCGSNGIGVCPTIRQWPVEVGRKGLKLEIHLEGCLVASVNKLL